MFHDHLDYFQKPSLGGRPNTKSRYQGIPNSHNRWFIYFILSCVRTHMNANSLKQHSVESPITYDFTLHLRVRDHTTWFRRCLGTAFGHFLLGPHDLMVTALGSYVKWPLGDTWLGHTSKSSFLNPCIRGRQKRVIVHHRLLKKQIDESIVYDIERTAHGFVIPKPDPDLKLHKCDPKNEMVGGPRFILANLSFLFIHWRRRCPVSVPQMPNT